MKRLATATILFLLSPGLRAQSINVDFGSAGSSYGVPPSTYGAVGRPGHWNAVGPMGATNLVDVGGSSTSVGITFTATNLTSEECDHPGTAGADEALLDDRLEFPAAFHSGMAIDFTNLEPGHYRVLFYSIDGAQAGCFPDDLLVHIAGSTWESLWLDWNGSFEANESYTQHVVDHPNGGTLRVHVEGYAYLTVWMSGLQLERTEDLAPYCFGDGSGTPCPCANSGGSGAGCANSTGAGGWLDNSGSTSLSLDDLLVRAHGLVPGKPAILFTGTEAIGGGSGAPFGDGLHCAGGSIVRLGVEVADVAGNATWGPGLAAQGGFGLGTGNFQVWYRDPVGSPCGAFFNMTHALRAYFVP